MSNQAARVKKTDINQVTPWADAYRANQVKDTGAANLAHQSSPKDINASSSKSNRQSETNSLIKVTSQLVELKELLSS